MKISEYSTPWARVDPTNFTEIRLWCKLNNIKGLFLTKKKHKMPSHPPL